MAEHTVRPLLDEQLVIQCGDQAVRNKATRTLHLFPDTIVLIAFDARTATPTRSGVGKTVYKQQPTVIEQCDAHQDGQPPIQYMSYASYASYIDQWIDANEHLWVGMKKWMDDLNHSKKWLYDAHEALRRRDQEQTELRRREAERRATESREREERYRERYHARWFNRECAEQQEVRRDQHCRVRELKAQHARSLQPHYARAKRHDKENTHCQQPRTAQPHYRRRNEVKFNNASVHRPKGGKKKTQ
jgi:hypothetical protein